MIRQDVERRNPVKETVYTVIFPGYFLWKREEKIQAFSVSVATYIGYLIVIGFLIHLFMLYFNWKKTIQHNKTYGFQPINQEELRWTWISGVIGGISGHPLFLLIIYQWSVNLDLIIRYNTNLIQVNPFTFLFLLSMVFGLRFLLFYSLRRTVGGNKNAELTDEFQKFSSNNACLVILTPLLPIMLIPLTQALINQIIAFIILPLSIIFGFRVLYNNLQSIV